MEQTSDVLPGCTTLEETDQRYRVEAMQMELRERRAWDLHRPTSLKEIERHFDTLRILDADIYKTYLYTTARIGLVFSGLTDAQLRRGLSAVYLGIEKLYVDDKVIRPSVTEYRADKHSVRDQVVTDMRARINELLPEMIAIVTSEAQKTIPVRYVRHFGPKGKKLVPIPAENPLSPTLAEAALRLRIMAYLRHPIDLLREIESWLVDVEDSE